MEMFGLRLHYRTKRKTIYLPILQRKGCIFLQSTITTQYSRKDFIMKFQEINSNVYFCGLNDINRKFFDELIPLKCGTTYNSYLIKGSDKTALIDTMYPPKSEEYLKNLDENGINHIDFIIANHGEQDHTGTIPKLLEKYPNAKIVTNQVCKGNIMSMLHVNDDKFIIVVKNDTLSLGDKTLTFYITPGVHWPDTMFTYLNEDKMLFTCDFLGAHYTSDTCMADYSSELEKSAKRYYAEIMMPCRIMCEKYVKQIKSIEPKWILPSHGPVYDNTKFILDLYSDWTNDEGKNLVVLPYVSMYGSTEDLIDYLISKFNSAGIEAKKFDIVDGDLGELAMDLVDATTIILGTSMVLCSPHPMAANVAYLTNLLRPKAKYASFVGSYGWGGNLFGELTD